MRFLKFSDTNLPKYLKRVARQVPQAAEARAGLVLMAATALALGMANSPLAGAWHSLFHEAIFAASLPLLPHGLGTLHGVIDDGLMAVFFFTVGLEIKREVLAGDLAHRSTRTLPILAAGAGMIGPSLIFLGVVQSGGRAEMLHGWAIPAATDSAFAMGVIGLLGRRVPTALRLFLLTVAVVDDLGAVAIIAIGYSGPIAGAWAGAAAGLWLAMVALNLGGCRRIWAYCGLA